MNAQPEVQVYFGRVKAFLCLFCCSPYFLLYDKGRLVRVGIAALRVGARLKERKEGGGGEEEGRKIRLAPFPPLFLSFKWCFRKQKHLCAQRKLLTSSISVSLESKCVVSPVLQLNQTGVAFFCKGRGRGEAVGLTKAKKNKQTR